MCRRSICAYSCLLWMSSPHSYCTPEVIINKRGSPLTITILLVSSCSSHTGDG